MRVFIFFCHLRRGQCNGGGLTIVNRQGDASSIVTCSPVKQGVIIHAERVAVKLERAGNAAVGVVRAGEYAGNRVDGRSNQAFLLFSQRQCKG